MKAFFVGVAVCSAMLVHLDYVQKKRQQQFNAAVAKKAESLIANGMSRNEAELVATHYWEVTRDSHPEWLYR